MKLSTLKALWKGTPDSFKRVVHTFWQSFAAVFLLGIAQVISDLIQTGNFSAGKSAAVALVVAATSAGLSAVKGLAQAKR